MGRNRDLVSARQEALTRKQRAEARYQAVCLDRFCQLCDGRDTLVVRIDPSLDWSVGNAITLCVDCADRVHVADRRRLYLATGRSPARRVVTLTEPARVDIWGGVTRTRTREVQQ